MQQLRNTSLKWLAHRSNLSQDTTPMVEGIQTYLSRPTCTGYNIGQSSALIGQEHQGHRLLALSQQACSLISTPPDSLLERDPSGGSIQCSTCTLPSSSMTSRKETTRTVQHALMASTRHQGGTPQQDLDQSITGSLKQWWSPSGTLTQCWATHRRIPQAIWYHLRRLILFPNQAALRHSCRRTN